MGHPDICDKKPQQRDHLQAKHHRKAGLIARRCISTGGRNRPQVNDGPDSPLGGKSAKEHQQVDAGIHPAGQVDRKALGQYRIGDDAGGAENAEQDPQGARPRSYLQNNQALGDHEGRHARHCDNNGFDANRQQNYCLGNE